MAFAEAGMLHRDISAYNILLINPEAHYLGTDGKWNNTVKGSLGNLVWKCLSPQPLPDVVSNATDMEIANSGRSWREEYIDDLGRGPYAVLCDAEHAVNEKRALEVHRDRTGTPIFVSAQLLLNPVGRAPVHRSFVHDIESLMWVLVWVTIHQDPQNMSEKAREFARELSRRDLNALGEFKQSTTQRYLALRQTITEFGNPWSKQLAPTIQTMARFFADFLYPNEDPNIESSDNQVFAPLEFQFRYPDFERPDPRAQIGRDEHLLRMKEDRLRTFQYFLELFGCSIASLSPGVEEVDIERV
ncbi:hypothetical protein FS749_008541 [Ceratobasidium sp. UAMH 11750]|nr:hypothetical protein FS749_008541 [Ceratobasidium sp. UAMH 11750]